MCAGVAAHGIGERAAVKNHRSGKDWRKEAVHLLRSQKVRSAWRACVHFGVVAVLGQVLAAFLYPVRPGVVRNEGGARRAGKEGVDEAPRAGVVAAGLGPLRPRPGDDRANAVCKNLAAQTGLHGNLSDSLGGGKVSLVGRPIR